MQYCHKKTAIKDLLTYSLLDTICVISTLFHELKLKDIPFSSFSLAITDEMNAHHKFLNLINETLPQDATKKGLLKSLFDKQCQVRHYTFSVLKCSEPECQFHKAPRLPEVVFQKIHHLPDPIIAADGLHSKQFLEVYGTHTTDQDYPSLKIGKKQWCRRGGPLGGGKPLGGGAPQLI